MKAYAVIVGSILALAFFSSLIAVHFIDWFYDGGKCVVSDFKTKYPIHELDDRVLIECKILVDLKGFKRSDGLVYRPFDEF